MIRCDPERPGLLYAGTETGVYISFDDGKYWQRFQLNLPVTPIHDLLVKGSDLIAATHGRSFWILDDLTRLRQLADDFAQTDALLLKPRDTQRILESIDARRLVDQPGKTYQSSTGIMAAYTYERTPENVIERKFLDSGENLPRGVLVTYYLIDAPTEKITLRIADAAGNLLNEFSSLDDAERAKQKEKPDKSIVYVTANAGWNRFVWDMRLPLSPKLNGKDPQFERMPGPTVVPGSYKLTLDVDDQTLTQEFELVKDPTSGASAEDSQAQFDLLMRIYSFYAEATEMVNTMRRCRAQLSSVEERLSNDGAQAELSERAADLKKQTLDIEKGIFIPDLREGWPGRVNQGTDPLRRLSALPSVVGLGEFPPTVQSYEVFEKLTSEIGAQIDKFEKLRRGGIADFNAALAETGFEFIG